MDAEEELVDASIIVNGVVHFAQSVLSGTLHPAAVEQAMAVALKEEPCKAMMAAVGTTAPDIAPQRTAKQRKAAARAAAQQQQRAAAEVVLLLLLQHDSIRTQLCVAARLLCCSKELAAAVADHCAGRLAVDSHRFHNNAAREQQAERWLRKHARLLREIRTQFVGPGLLRTLVAAGPQHLQLQSLETGGLQSLRLLERLPAQCLTRLALDDMAADEPLRAQHAARLSAAISRLTALQDLGLEYGESSLELPGLSALTGLTRAWFAGPTPSLQHLPVQLLELQLDEDAEDDPEPRDLRHLTTLTSLAHRQGTTPEVDDVLPPSLLRLRVSNCRRTQPLLQLTNLQDLQARLIRCDITAAQLVGLSRLSCLDLSYGPDSDDSDEEEETAAVVPSSSPAWALLPLQSLLIRRAKLPAAVCQHLGQVTSLTRLRLEDVSLRGDAQPLATALCRLSGLQELGICLGSNRSLFATGQLVQAIGSLTQLRVLDVTGIRNFADAGLGGLGSLASFTQLHLCWCRLEDADMVPLISQLSGLQNLGLFDNKSLTDAVLPGIGRLRQLTALNLSGTRVTGEGMRHLTGLTRLCHLGLLGVRGVTAAGVSCLSGLTNLTCLRDE